MDDSLSIGSIVAALFPGHRPGAHEQEGYGPAVVVGLPDLAGRPRFDCSSTARCAGQRLPHRRFSQREAIRSGIERGAHAQRQCQPGIGVTEG